MMHRRLWRDAPLTDERVVLGSAHSPGAQGAGGSVAIGAQNAREGASGIGVQATHSAMTAEIAILRDQLSKAQERCAALAVDAKNSQRATEDAEEALLALRADIERERASAQEKGHTAGVEKARGELETQMQGWRRASEEMLRSHDERWQALRGELADVVMAAVAKIIGEQSAHPQLARAAVEQVLRESGVSAPARVLLAPSQYEQLMKAGAAQLAAFKERRLELAADSRVAHGGCVIETAAGLIDGRFEVQLGKLREIVASHFGGAGR